MSNTAEKKEKPYTLPNNSEWLNFYNLEEATTPYERKMVAERLAKQYGFSVGSISSTLDDTASDICEPLHQSWVYRHCRVCGKASTVAIRSLLKRTRYTNLVWRTDKHLWLHLCMECSHSEIAFKALEFAKMCRLNKQS